MEYAAVTAACLIHTDLPSVRVPLWPVRSSRRRAKTRSDHANLNQRGIITLFIMRRRRLEMACLGSPLASFFYHGGPLSPTPAPPPPLSHKAVYVPDWFRTHDARVTGQDVVLFNDAEHGHTSLLAYFPFTVSRSKTPSFYVQTHIPRRARSHISNHL